MFRFFETFLPSYEDHMSEKRLVAIVLTATKKELDRLKDDLILQTPTRDCSLKISYRSNSTGMIGLLQTPTRDCLSCKGCLGILR